MSGEGGLQEEDKWALICVVFCFLVTGASLIDFGLSQVHHTLEHHSGLHEHGDRATLFYTYSLQPGAIFFKIWTRLQTEMMVLGCLAFTIWVADEYGFFDWARHGEKHTEREEYNEVHFEVNRTFCPRRWPTEGEVLLAVAERVHFQLFMATAVYFGCLALAFYMHLRRMRRIGEREVAAAENRPAVTDTDRRADEDIRVLRACILHGFVPNDSSPVDVQGKLSVRAFVQRASKKNVEHLIAFPLLTWLVILALATALALATRFVCIPGENVMVALKAWHLAVTTYLLVRIRLFWRGAQQLDRAAPMTPTVRLRDETEPRLSVVHNTWPAPLLDRILCPLLAGLSGFHPLGQQPNLRMAISLTQAMLWIEIFLLMASTQYMNGYKEQSEQQAPLPFLIAWDLVEVLVIGLFVCVVIPNMIIIFCMPPFLSGDANAYVGQVLRCFPEGVCPAEDRDLLKHGEHYQESTKVEDEVDHALQVMVGAAVTGAMGLTQNLKHAGKHAVQAVGSAAHSGLELGGGILTSDSGAQTGRDTEGTSRGKNKQALLPPQRAAAREEAP
jgi:hypothetical protein